MMENLLWITCWGRKPLCKVFVEFNTFLFKFVIASPICTFRLVYAEIPPKFVIASPVRSHRLLSNQIPTQHCHSARNPYQKVLKVALRFLRNDKFGVSLLLEAIPPKFVIASPVRSYRLLSNQIPTQHCHSVRNPYYKVLNVALRFLWNDKFGVSLLL